MRPPRPAVIYHAGCLDGRAAAAVVERFHGPIDEHPWTYGRPRPPAMLDREVWILDCCLPIAVMREIEREARRVTWLDHHDSAVPVQQQLGWGSIDLQECGATLTWRHCADGAAMPAILAYVRDKDLWQWRLPESRAIVQGLQALWASVELAALWEFDLEHLRQTGAPLLVAIQEEVARIVRRGVTTHDAYGVLGSRAMVLNNANYLNEVAEAAQAAGHDLVVQFVMRGDGRWLHSLRAAQVDCAAIAESRGGGGHRQAAAYLADQPFPVSSDCLYWPF